MAMFEKIGKKQA